MALFGSLNALVDHQDDAIPLRVVSYDSLKGADLAWAQAQGFRAETGQVLAFPASKGGVKFVGVGLGAEPDFWSFALAQKLPKGIYRLEGVDKSRLEDACLAWELSAYQFRAFKASKAKQGAQLVWPDDVNRSRVEAKAQAITMVRDLINTPTSHLGPKELADAALAVASRYKAKARVIEGDQLLAANYPSIHAVGRAAASDRQPRLIDFTWGDEADPKLTLVGKGVCFDTGGLDLKPSSAMKLMKKDMGGAAHVLGLASIIMALGLKVRLRVLIPAVENSVSGSAMRPMDILNTRKGVTVEVGNTDAEGRLILSDALWEGSGEKPDLIIDMATLTGAARTALGTDIPALFTNDDNLARQMMDVGLAINDPVWQLPLWKGYRRLLDGKVADLNNISDGPYAGAITAALFLQEFVSEGVTWAHLDLMAWNLSSRPGRPDGGEAMTLRTLWAVLENRFGH